MTRILVAGASGLIGSALVAALRAAGHDVRTLVRRDPRAATEYRWDPARGVLDAAHLDGVEAVINLAGASIGRIPWTPAYRRELVLSRVGPTRLLAETMARMATPPRVFLSGSASGFYGDRPGESLDDASTRGDGFLADLVADWEAAAALAPAATRVVMLRTSVVVARSGGMAPVRIFTQAFLGTVFGSGRQYWPWISRDDEVRAIIHLLDSDLSGAVVLAGPTPATADEVTRAFATALKRPRWLRAPGFAIRLLLGEAGRRLLLDDTRVTPTRLAADGFTWQHPTVAEAIDAALSSRE